MGNMKLDHFPFLLTGYTCYFVPNVLILIALITFLRKGNVKFSLLLCAAVERKERGLRGWSGVELTTQSPRCRSDDHA